MESLLAAVLEAHSCTAYDSNFVEYQPRHAIHAKADVPFVFYVQCQLTKWDPADVAVVVGSAYADAPAPYPFDTLSAKLKHKAASVFTFTATFKDVGNYPLLLYVANKAPLFLTFFVE